MRTSQHLKDSMRAPNAANVHNVPKTRRFLMVWLTPYQTVPTETAYDLVEVYFDQMVAIRIDTENRCSAKGYWHIDSFHRTCQFIHSGFLPATTRSDVDRDREESVRHILPRLCKHTDGEILTILFDHVTIAQISIALPKRTVPVDYCVNCVSALDKNNEICCDSCRISAWCGQRCFSIHNAASHFEWCTNNYFRQLYQTIS